MSQSNGTTPATLEVKDLHATVEGKEILQGIDLIVRQGETHALMGPNGSGKSTLSNVIMGRPGYVVTGGKVMLNGEDITALTTDQRAQRGLFLAMQYPTEVPGVSVVNFLRTAYQAVKVEQVSALAFRKHMKEQMEKLGKDLAEQLKNGQPEAAQQTLQKMVSKLSSAQRDHQEVPAGDLQDGARRRRARGYARPPAGAHPPRGQHRAAGPAR